MIRVASLGDVSWLVEAGARAQQESPFYAEYTSNAAEQYKRIVRLLLRPELICIRVVEDGSGFICGTLEPTVWFEETLATVNLLWVAPEKRGTWRAWRLVEAFELWARGKAARVVIGVSSGINESLVERFYAKMGYTRQGSNFVKVLK